MSISGSISAVGHSYLDVASGTRLDAWFPAGASDDAPPARSCLAVELGVNVGETVAVTIDDLAAPPADLTDAYLRLHLLSRREIRPHEANLDGVFGLLTNCAWTSAGPVLPDRVDALRTAAAGVGQPVTVTAVDKIPRMVDYVIPSGVRIADADRVRLGAHLAGRHPRSCTRASSTSTPARSVPPWSRGASSAGVVVGAHSDLGGSASTMGTLSGGGKEIVSVGEHCLLGANSGIGIALGDYCTVEAGLYVTAGSRITLPDGSVVKGRDISGRSGMLLIRNSTSGAIEMRVADPSRWEGINPELHKN